MPDYTVRVNLSMKVLDFVQFGGPERTGLRTCEIPSRSVNWVTDRGGTQTDFGVAKTLPPATQPLASNWRIRIVPQPARLYAKSRLESRIQCVAF